MLPDAAPRDTPDEEICERVTGLLEERVTVHPPSQDADLMATGLLDSLGLVDLLAGLEEEFRIVIELDDVDLERFRSVDSISRFVRERLAGSRRAGTGSGDLVEIPGGARRQRS